MVETFDGFVGSIPGTEELPHNCFHIDTPPPGVTATLSQNSGFSENLSSLEVCVCEAAPVGAVALSQICLVCLLFKVRSGP